MVLCCCAIGTVTLAQDFSPEQEFFIAQLIEELDEDIDVSELTERLRNFLRRPIELNGTDADELASLLFLSSLQIQHILRHRQLSGNYISVLELQAVYSMDPLSLERLYPFVRIGELDSWSDVSLGSLYRESEQQLMFRYSSVLERQAGYGLPDSVAARYLGDPNRYWLWYRLNYRDHLKISFNAKKDAGEPFFKLQQRYGFDHYGFSISLKNFKRAKELIIGDYSLQIGQGLLLWNGISFGKSASISSSVRQGGGLKAYSAMNEVDFLRGLAAKLQFKDFTVTPFFSFRRLTANVQTSDSGSYIHHIATTGLHRTPSEQSYRRALKQTVMGLSLDYQRQRLRLGLAAVNTNFDAPFMPSTQLRDQFSFGGNRLLNLGANFQYTYKNIFMYGEVGRLTAGGWASSTGLLASLHPTLSFFCHYRNYQRNYYAYFAQGFAEGSATANEKGFYLGMVYHPSRRLEYISYVDRFRFPWLRYNVNAPSAGFDFFKQLTYRWYKIGRIVLRYRYRYREENGSVVDHVQVLEDVFKRQLRLDFQYKLSSVWEVRTRMEYIGFRKEKRLNHGRLIYQDLFWRGGAALLSVNFRFALFNVDAYDARLYTYEQDVLYGQAFRVLNNAGIRYYVNFRYLLGRKTDLWLRYAATRYRDTQVVGTGLDRSVGNKRSEVKVQLRYQW